MNTTEQLNYSAPAVAVNPRAAPTLQKDKKVKLGRTKSPYRDGDFMRARQALSEIATQGVLADTSVIEAPTPSSPPVTSLSHLSPGHRQGIKEAQRTHTPTKSPAPARHPRWFEPFGSHGVSIHPQRRAPTPWRDASDYLRLEYFHLAMKALSPVHAFSLNLSHEIEELARSQSNPGDWLRRRIALELKSGLGRAVDFWMVVELDPDHFDESAGRKRPRLHIHGEIGVSAEEVKTARASLRRAGGEWAKARQHQVKTKPAPDAWWVGYCTKCLRTIDNFSVSASQFELIFSKPLPGSTVSKTRRVNAKAQEIFEKERAAVMRRKKR